MKWEITPAFEADLRRLTGDELARFREVVRKRFSPAADRIVADPGAHWSASFRVRRVAGAEGIWEMTWSFSGPDGRATFEWIEIGSERAIRWRRVGGHEIFGAPVR